ncbi:MAG: hypothetical protein Q4E88_06035 [Coriobacteriia bacterium]|nr:hypothetical protein [Coriobacteriia bacterium]
MYIQKNKRNNTTYYYLSKSVRDKGSTRPKTKVVESLGSREDLINKHGENFEQWLKDYAKKRTEDDENKKTKVTFEQKKLDVNSPRPKNIGYLIIKQICEKTGLKKICKHIEEKEKLNFNMFDMVVCIIARDLLDVESNSNLFVFVQTLYGTKALKREDITTTIKLLCKYNVYIQKMLYKNVSKSNSVKRNNLFYDCSNYGSIGSEIEKLKYSKHYSENVTLGKVFMDDNLLPCGFILENSLFDFKEDNKKILDNLKYRFDNATLYTLPDCIETTSDRSLYRRFTNNKQITFQTLDKFSDKDIKYFFDSKNWKNLVTSKEVDLEKIRLETISDNVSREEISKNLGSLFVKYIKEEDQTKLCAFSFEIQYWMRQIRDFQLKKFQWSVEEKLGQTDAKNKEQMEKKFDFLVSDIKDEETKIHFFNDRIFRQSEDQDGYFVLAEDLEIDILNNLCKALWQKYNVFDFCFKIFKPEFVLDKKLTFKESMVSHFLISYLTFFILRYMVFSLGDEYWYKDIVYQLSNMSIIPIDNNIWSPAYEVTSLIEKLTELCSLDINYNIISDEELQL